MAGRSAGECGAGRSQVVVEEEGGCTIYLSLYVDRMQISRVKTHFKSHSMQNIPNLFLGCNERECLLFELKIIPTVLPKFSAVKPKIFQH